MADMSVPPVGGKGMPQGGSNGPSEVIQNVQDIINNLNTLVQDLQQSKADWDEIQSSFEQLAGSIDKLQEDPYIQMNPNLVRQLTKIANETALAAQKIGAAQGTPYLDQVALQNTQPILADVNTLYRMVIGS